jgi:NADH-quinone oxidoreductase subunit J
LKGFSALFTAAQAVSADGLQQVAPLLFYGFGGLAVLSAWAVMLSQNIVRMAVYLLLTLCGVAGLYLMMGAEFLAAIQLIVYAGGILILIVFGVMLTSNSPFMQLRVKLWERFVGVLIAVVLAALLIFAVVVSPITPALEPAADPTVRNIGLALIHRFVVPFEVAGVLLLIVMIAAAYMARRRTGS